jgi:hypothetical protein
MRVKPFLMICGLTALAALLFFVTGNFTMLTAVVFGFIAFGLTFMGMMNVLPIAVTHTTPAKVEEPTPAPVQVEANAASPARVFNTWKSA